MYVIDTMRDITERKIAEAELLKSSQMWNNTFDAISDIVFIHSTDHRFVNINKAGCATLGMEKEQIIGQKCYKLVHGTDVPISACPCKDINSIQSYQRTEYAEHGRHFELEVWPIKESDGSVNLFTHIVRDITERKNAENMLKQNLIEKELLIRELYHRTKNNMQVIISLMNMQAKMSEDTKLQFYYKEIINRIKAMALVHQKLYDAQHLSRLNLGDLIQDIVNVIKRSHWREDKKIIFSLDLEEIIVTIDVAIPLSQVVEELVSNIILHAFPQKKTGEAKIRLFKDRNDIIYLEVSDNGIGINASRDLRKQGGLGLQNLFGLIDYQLKGKVEYFSKNGLHWKISFQNVMVERV